MFALLAAFGTRPRPAFSETSGVFKLSAFTEGVTLSLQRNDEVVLDSIAAGTHGTFTFIKDNYNVKEAMVLSLGGPFSVALRSTAAQLTAAQGVVIQAVSAGIYEVTVDEAPATASVALKVRL